MGPRPREKGLGRMGLSGGKPVSPEIAMMKSHPGRGKAETRICLPVAQYYRVVTRVSVRESRSSGYTCRENESTIPGAELTEVGWCLLSSGRTRVVAALSPSPRGGSYL